MNETAKDPRFCVNLMVTKGWVTSIDLESEDGLLPTQKVFVDYDQLPMRCKACHSWKHKVKDCNELKKRQGWGGRRPLHAPHTLQQEKGKNTMVDEDGFQQVKNRRNTRRNIFDTVNDEMRTSAFALAEEVWATRYRSMMQGEEGGRRNDGQKDREEGTSEMQKENAQTKDTEMRAQSEESDGSPLRIDTHAITERGQEEHAKSDLGEIEEGTRPGESGEPGTTTAGAATTEEETVAMEQLQAQEVWTPTGGRGDPTSTMLWSPRKHFGFKRPLEVEEAEDTK